MLNGSNKTLLVISGGAEAVPGIRRAKAMGLHVVVSDMNAHAPGFEFADDALIASTYDVEQTISVARDYHCNRRKLDGVICMAADVPLTVASVADALGLPGLSLETAQLAADKLLMKQRFQRDGVAIPWFSAVASLQQLQQIVSERGINLVIKPVDSRGARGVLLLNGTVDLAWAYQHARSQSPTGRVMVEQYLPGPQVSSETVMVEEVGYTSGFSDRNYEHLQRFAPYVIENGGDMPSRLSQINQQAITDLAEQAARSMGIMNGIAKGDMVITDEGPKVIEIAARLSGGWFSSDQIPLSTGVDILGAAIQLALGVRPNTDELLPQSHQGVTSRYFFARPGVVKAIHHADRYTDRPWVHKLGFFIEPGETIGAMSDHTKRAGFVITLGCDRAEAVARAEEVINNIVIEMQ